MRLQTSNMRVQMVWLARKGREIYSKRIQILISYYFILRFFFLKYFFLKFERKLFLKFHRQLFCWLDQWHGLTIADIRKIEDHLQEELKKVSCNY